MKKTIASLQAHPPSCASHVCLKDNDEVAVLSAVSCFMRRNLTRIHDYFK